MTNEMMMKVENLRNMIGDGVDYKELERLTFRNEKVPSISALRRYNLLTIVRIEEYKYEMTEEELEEECGCDDDYFNEWEWNDEEEKYIMIIKVNYYGIK